MSPDASTPALRFLRDVADLAPLIRAQAPHAEQEGRVDPALIAELKRRRFFRLWIPASVDGVELDLPSSIDVFEAMSYEDGVVGWTIMIGAGGGLFATLLPAGSAQEIFGPADAVIAGSGSPSGVSHRDNGVYRVEGRWRFASGVYHATWFTANTVVHEGGSPLTVGGGARVIRAVAMPAASVEVIQNWDVTGMRATASHDFAAHGVAVPAHHTFDVTGAPRDPGPLYRYPFSALTSLSTAAITLGIARRALDEWAAYARGRSPRAGGGTSLAELPFATARYAEAWVMIEAARTLWRAEAARSWAIVAGGAAMSPQDCARVDIASAHAAASSSQAVGLLYDMAGMDVLSSDSPFGRCWRDLHAVRQHGSVAPSRRESAGRALLTGTPGDDEL